MSQHQMVIKDFNQSALETEEAENGSQDVVIHKRKGVSKRMKGESVIRVDTLLS